MKNEQDEHRWPLWMSPGAALGITITCCLIALVVAFLVLPAAHKAERADAKQAALSAAAVENQRNGTALLHRFDCTYGRATVLALQNAEKTALRAALLARRNARALRKRRQLASSRVSTQNYRNQTRSAKQYHNLLLTLKPLGPKRPCP